MAFSQSDWPFSMGYSKQYIVVIIIIIIYTFEDAYIAEEKNGKNVIDFQRSQYDESRTYHIVVGN